ncbi:MAG: fibrobacter succinogenes major paralogous domain-containing protein [Bacteroidales bacterium]|nr:fibrobacter succinogenes major paralogous domain-containing protein [Bacteroidales bacterium]
MKKVMLLVSNIFMFSFLFAQSPNSFNYQAIVRDNSGELISEQLIGVEIDILQGSSSGTSVYLETHSETSNDYGLINLKIGTGITTDDFNSINWANGPYFIQISLDVTGGETYQVMGTSQLLSVPYALHAKSAENILESDPVYTAWNKDYNDLTNTPNIIDSVNAVIDTTAQFIRTEVDGDETNEIQNLSQVLAQNNDGGSVQIKNIADPTDAQDVATKAYVEDMLVKGGVIVVDVENNIYSTLRIGTQVWMSENLKTTQYNDGTEIPIETDNTIWAGLTTGAYCWLNNDEANKDVFGALYNWYAVDNGNLCPTGWHVPSEAEWDILRDYLGGQYAAGGALKESGTEHWTTPNTDATNSSGFSALPGLMRRDGAGAFYTIVGMHAYFWTSDEAISNTANGVHKRLNHNSAELYPKDDYGKIAGFSVRCVKD